MRQVKSNLYYVFWGIATISVVAGQVYVGSGYREMANEVEDVSSEVAELTSTVKSAFPWSGWGE